MVNEFKTVIVFRVIFTCLIALLEIGSDVTKIEPNTLEIELVAKHEEQVDENGYAQLLCHYTYPQIVINDSIKTQKENIDKINKSMKDYILD